MPFHHLPTQPTNRHWPTLLICQTCRNPPRHNLRLSLMHKTLPRRQRHTNRHTRCPNSSSNNTKFILILLAILSMGTLLMIRRCGAPLLDSGKENGRNSWMVYDRKFPRLIVIYRDHSHYEFEFYFIAALFFFLVFCLSSLFRLALLLSSLPLSIPSLLEKLYPPHLGRASLNVAHRYITNK